ncbi:MAG: hypothetical protein ACYC2Y_08105 [Armatimonadota bacterium]
MKTSISAILAICALTLISAATFAEPPPGAFLTDTAISTQGLIDVVRLDPIAAGRYARHFGMTPDEVLTYFRQNLTVKTLDEPGSYTVYYLDAKGRIRSRVSQIPAGEPVFMTRTGQPVLLVKCGNPLVTKLPKVPDMPKSEVAQVEAAPDMVVAAAPAEPIAIDVPIAAQPVIPEEKVAGVMEQLLSPALGAVGEIGAALLGAVTFVPSSSHTDEPVPEPTGLLVMASGIPALYFALKRRR